MYHYYLKCAHFLLLPYNVHGKSTSQLIFLLLPYNVHVKGNSQLIFLLLPYYVQGRVLVSGYSYCYPSACMGRVQVS